MTTVNAAAAKEKMNLSKEEIQRYLATAPYTLPNHKKFVAPPMVYISGEEMTHYTMNLMLDLLLI
jgi:hypothetical protein